LLNKLAPKSFCALSVSVQDLLQQLHQKPLILGKQFQPSTRTQN
jgi:hypothetical protein